MFTLPNGTHIGFGQTFTIEGEKFSPTWLRRADNDALAAKGITRYEPPQPEAFDSRFYFAAGVPRDVTQCKKMLVDAVKAYVSSSLAQSDWQIIREQEDPANKKASVAIREYRKSLRANGNALETEINALADTAACAAWQQHDWPVDPSAPVQL